MLGALVRDRGYTLDVAIAERNVVNAEQVRHFETPTLWVQKASEDKKFVVHKVPGQLNVLHICTNHVDC